jgi:hypothetical protein
VCPSPKFWHIQLSIKSKIAVFAINRTETPRKKTREMLSLKEMENTRKTRTREKRGTVKLH